MRYLRPTSDIATIKHAKRELFRRRAPRCPRLQSHTTMHTCAPFGSVEPRRAPRRVLQSYTRHGPTCTCVHEVPSRVACGVDTATLCLSRSPNTHDHAREARCESTAPGAPQQPYQASEHSDQPTTRTPYHSLRIDRRRTATASHAHRHLLSATSSQPPHLRALPGSPLRAAP